MGVELGVAGPAGAVPERGADEAVGFDEVLPVASSAGVTRLGGQVVEHGADRPIVGDGDRVVHVTGPERPEKRDALGGGERQVIAGPTLRAELHAQVLSGGGSAGEQVPKHLSIDLADEPEALGGRSDPLAGRFTPTEVVVVDVVGDLVEVVLRATGDAEPPYRQHRSVRRWVFGDRPMPESSAWTSP